MQSSVIGRGAYHAPKAARLLRLEAPGTESTDVHRWAFGYVRHSKRYGGAIRLDEFSRRTGTISFLELVELAYIAGMLESGASWPKVHAAMRAAAQMLPNELHPFAHQEWFADPAGIYLRLGKKHGERTLIEMAEGLQYTMEGLLRTYLRQLQFNPSTGLADVWAPLGENRPILIDPQRSFGLPIVTSGVRTDILFGHYDAGDKITEIAGWYDVPETEVEAAIDFEERLQPIAA